MNGNEILQMIQQSVGVVPLTAEENAAEIRAAMAGGFATGEKEAFDRVNAILSHPGIAGDGKRMAAAVDLIATQPGMTAAAIASFVVTTVPSGLAADQAGRLAAMAAAYEAERAAGLPEGMRAATAGLAQPMGRQADGSRKPAGAGAWDKHVEAANARLDAAGFTGVAVSSADLLAGKMPQPASPAGAVDPKEAERRASAAAWNSVLEKRGYH